jgi:hypothetical protein
MRYAIGSFLFGTLGRSLSATERKTVMSRFGVPLAAVLLPIMGCYSCFGPVTAEDFDTELSAWRLEAEAGGLCHIRLVGECDAGEMLFLYQLDVDAPLTRFFDAGTGRFLGHDDRGAMCGWGSPPIALRCRRDGIVTEVVCGADYYEVGDPLPR